MNIYKCPIHGDQRHSGNGADMFCPSCKADANPSARPITKEEEAVVEAAKDWAEQFDEIKAGMLHATVTDGAAGLRAAVRALTAPNGVRPEEVKPGTRFRFKGSPDTNIYRLVDDGAAGRYWLCEEDWRVRDFFNADDLIIPLEEE